jgi:N-acetylneuraminic acid mutarotase
MPLPRAGTMAASDGRRLLVAGGTYWEGDTKRWSDRADWYDPIANRWSPAPSLPAARGDAACAVLGSDAAVYLLGGGEHGSTTADALRLAGGAWRDAPEWRLPAPRLYPVATVMDGRVWVVGGLPASGDYANASATVWSSSGQGWRAHAEVPGPRRAHFALAALNGRLHLFGGYGIVDGKPVNHSDAYEYDPSRNQWRALPTLPVARRAWWAVRWGGRILVFGGYTDTFEDSVYAFDPRTREFSLAGSLPRGVADARFVLAGDRILTAGGESGNRVRAGWTWIAGYE